MRRVLMRRRIIVVRMELECVIIELKKKKLDTYLGIFGMINNQNVFCWLGYTWALGWMDGRLISPFCYLTVYIWLDLLHAIIS